MYHGGGPATMETTMASSCEVNEASNYREQANASQEANSLEKMRERYEEQQRRLACPSCGEEPFLD
jgi:hypothetical protein